MINYTTPTISLIVEGVDISSHEVYVTLEQGKTELTKKGDDLIINTEQIQQVTNTNITFVLTQQESAAFDYNRNVSVQVNWITSAGARSATEIKQIDVMRNLLDKVIDYGN